MDIVSAILRSIEKPPPVVAVTDVGDLVVSTVDTYDCSFETAIVDVNGVYPVQRYESVYEAKRGHDAWVSKTKPGLVVTQLGHPDLDALDVHCSEIVTLEV